MSGTFSGLKSTKNGRRKRFLIPFFCAALALAPAADAGEFDSLHTTLGSVPPFKLLDQQGKTVERDRLLGKVCVVSVFFSCCTTMCPLTQKTMEGLQAKFANYPDVLLVSINVYPGHDTQAIIAQYASDHHADPGATLALPLRAAVNRTIFMTLCAEGGFKQGLGQDPSAPPGLEVNHTPTFLVVDHHGVIRGYVDGRDNAEVGRLEGFVKQLVQAKYFPSINAGLNATCGVLLILGFAFIRGRWVVAHKICMLAAVVVSAVFLSCYLYYHIVVQDGKPTSFGGEGPIRYLYLGILLSHTVLAIAVAPAALRLTYLGLRNRLASHMRLARWTLPIWLYVSVTGVVVYWMLYHLYPPA